MFTSMRRIAVTIAVGVFCAVLGFGAVTAIGGDDITDLLLHNKTFREAFDRQQEQKLKDFERKSAVATAGFQQPIAVSGVAPGVESIIRTELLPITEADLASEQDPGIRALSKGAYKLRIYYNDGSIDEIMPVKKMPKRIELKDIEGKKILAIGD